MPLVVAAQASGYLQGEALPAGARLIDRIIAVVDDDPILWSDLERAIELELYEPRAGESRQMLERRLLDSLIEQRLRLHELDRYGAAEIEVTQVDAEIAALEERLGGPEALEQRLAELQITRRGLEALFVRQLKILRFVEERLGPRVFVDLEAIEAYYDGEFAERLAAVSDPDSPVVVPPLADVREQIRAVLRERYLNEEIDKWTQELRRAADVVDFLEE
jgi:hypothetical protein